MTVFKDFNPSSESYWRSIILFGNNVASYKFSLGKVLLEFAKNQITTVSIEDLALPFAQHISKHLRLADRQCTNPSSKFIDACRKYNAGELPENTLRSVSKQHGFNNVIDAFHIVNQGEVPVRFFIDERKTNKRIVITDKLLKLSESKQFDNLPFEVEARWRLVETAWSLRISSNLLQVQHDEELNSFYVESSNVRRVNITSARDALNGYQKGKCFYCFTDISILQQEGNSAEIDHFFAHILRVQDLTLYSTDLNGIWNLVLACPRCNRGENGKFAKLPLLKYLVRLHTRNSFLINSHHPLRETLINQMGQTENERRSFLQKKYDFAKERLIHEWQPVEELEAAF